VKHLSGAPLVLEGVLLALPTNIDLAGKACQEQTLKLITKILTYGRKMFYNIGPWFQMFYTIS
jgi:hypothetical protein